jgi:hypothetical protein
MRDGKQFVGIAPNEEKMVQNLVITQELTRKTLEEELSTIP